jgi:ubiquinol-cytochrome c reductase cytochrome b/c1 subunit
MYNKVKKNYYINLLIKYIENHIRHYGTPITFSYFWSFGSLIGLMLFIQILTGLFLALYYIPHTDLAFESVEDIIRNVFGGWFIRSAHANGASMLFILLYIHISRGFYYRSYQHPRHFVWITGVIIFILMAGTAFLGYVLPWGQMSFWGATVITNILSSIPIFGESLVIWIWGGFSVNSATLERFFILHFFLPFVITVLAFIHIFLLHRVGSSNPNSYIFTEDNIHFAPYFILKDIFSLFIFLILFIFIIIYFPDFFGHSDNYIKADPTVTPVHIVPEWYFLPFYAILKSIPSKLGGTIAMGASIGVLFILPFVDYSKSYNPKVKIFSDFFFVTFLLTVLLLGWLGGRVPTNITLIFNQILTTYYFFYFLVIVPALSYFNEQSNKKNQDKDLI